MTTKASVWEVRYSYLPEGKNWRRNNVTLVLCDSIERAIELVKDGGTALADLAIDQILKRTSHEILVDPILMKDVE